MEKQCWSVLVVEDDEAVRAVLTQILEGEGYEVDVADDGEKGLLAALENTPDAILLDLTMPDTDGWAFLRERPRHVTLATVPILVMSAGREDDLKRAKQLGANAYLAKPFDVDVLLALVQQLVDPHRRQHDVPVDTVPGRGAIFLSTQSA